MSSEEQDEIDSLLFPDHLNFEDWLREARPGYNWDYDHLIYTSIVLQLVAEGTIKKLIVNFPPQHGKSTLITTSFPAYMLEMNPRLNIMIGSYSAKLVRGFSRDIKDITQARGLVDIRKDSHAADHWETVLGGQVHAVPVRGAATGEPSDITIVDDPYKDLDEADSDVVSEQTWSTFKTAWLTRRSKNWRCIVVHTRWNKKDITERLLESEPGEWYVLNFPAIAEENDLLGRKPGEALCPDMHPIEDILSNKKIFTEREFEGIFQGHPVVPGGNIFKVDKLHFIDQLPTEIINGKIVPVEIELLCVWDRAGTSNAGDWTVGALIGLDKYGRWYILDIDRAQFDDLGVDNMIDEVAAKHGRDVPHFFQEDPGAAGKGDRARTVRRLVKNGFSASSERPTGSKQVRARIFTAAVANGDVYVLVGPWNSALVEELREAPAGHDDQWDAISMGFNKLAGSNAEGFMQYLQKQIGVESSHAQSELKCNICGHIQSEGVEPEEGDPCENCGGYSMTRTQTR